MHASWPRPWTRAEGADPMAWFAPATLLGAVLVGAGLVAVPFLRSLAVGVAVGGLAWFVLMPRRWLEHVDRRTRGVIIIFLVARVLMPAVAESLGVLGSLFFGGGSDAFSYHAHGATIAQELLTTGRATAQRGTVPGTASIDLAVGYFYAVGAPARTVAYYLAGELATIGMLLFWWSTKDLTGRLHSRYAGFVLLTPSLLFWNSSLGKEAAITLAIGCIVAGFRLVSELGRPVRGLGYLAVGTVVGGFVRPHIVILLLATVTIGMVVTRLPREERGGRRLRRVLPLLIAGVGFVVLLPATGAVLHQEQDQSLVEAAQATAKDTATVGGGSSFTARPVGSVLDLPRAVVTVLLRPFPWEVRTLAQVLASVEATVLGFLLARKAWWVLRRRARLPSSPLVPTAVAFTLMLCLAFASLGNLGLLTRERMQLLPFVIFLIFAVRAPAGGAEDDGRAAGIRRRGASAAAR